ncbi:MAG: hypothetical protein SCALA702_29310 [Melioribacteraceae bacterium]|nr:MAG: hypothetical protein SCALA702_29310 [Melioribacteraceae bacterium]
MSDILNVDYQKYQLGAPKMHGIIISLLLQNGYMYYFSGSKHPLVNGDTSDTFRKILQCNNYKKNVKTHF